MPLYETTGDSETRLEYHVGYWPFVPPENAAALDLLHKWQSEDPAYDREAWARLTGARVTEQDAITFDAVIPSNMSALRIHGESGMRITLDVDETNLPEALKLVLWRERVLRVTIEPAE